MTNAITLQDPANTKSAIFNPTSLEKLQAFSEVMAQGRVSIPSHLTGKPADCLAVLLQAVQWNMNPYSVAQKTSVVNGGLCYEAQLVNAIVTSSHAVSSRFKYEYAGPWDKYRPGDRTANAEKGLCIRVGAVLTGETEITWGEWLYLEFVKVRNSPLWSTAPKQQFGYLAVKYWARQYTPDVILGVYTPDEMATSSKAERDVTPVPAPQTAEDLNRLIGTTFETELVDKETRSPAELLDSFTQAALKVKTRDDLQDCYQYCLKHLGDDPELLSKAAAVYESQYDQLA